MTGSFCVTNALIGCKCLTYLEEVLCLLFDGFFFLVSCSSDESSWKRASELLVEVANHGEATGYEVPCLMVSAKDDIASSQISIQDSTRVRVLID